MPCWRPVSLRRGSPVGMAVSLRRGSRVGVPVSKAKGGQWGASGGGTSRAQRGWDQPGPAGVSGSEPQAWAAWWRGRIAGP